MASTAHVPDDLPPDLADAAAERLLAAERDRRGAELEALCAERPQHAAALRRLATELAAADALLGQTFPPSRRDEPSRIGGHRVVRKLGEGAFGVVYLCAQEQPVAREVAIKVLRPGAGDARTLRRFTAERQVLADLNHPSITQVFDAGELDDGRPFFVMEYVAGRPISTWCEANGLSCADRLRLFVQVCRGVAHAHARGIVHRDLKPANVLVVDTGDGPRPKIIDFGIAKALVTKSTDDTAASEGPRTDAGRVVGTPGYMSPEQAAGRAFEVDARADVFALGVMLYELLTGVLPWAEGAGGTETDPPRPSARVTTATQSAAFAVTAERRHLAALLRGDLDWITLKALARVREERYPAVADLVADIERHLRGDPVSVGPPSLRYRVRKFVRRHRTATGAAAGGFVLVVLLAWALVYASGRDSAATDAQDDARSLVARLLRRADDPALYGTAAGDDVRRVLGAEALHLSERLLANDPGDARLQAVRCEVLQSVAQVHWLLGEPERSRTAAAEAVAIGERLLDAAPADVPRRALLAGAQRQLGRAIVQGGDQGAARGVLERAAGHLAACAETDPKAYTAPYAAVLRECAEALPDTDTERRITLCRQAVQQFGSLVTDVATGAVVRDDRVHAHLGLARALFEARRFDEARDELDRLAPLVVTTPLPPFSVRIEFHRLRGQVAWDKGERLPALPDMEIAASVADEWCRTQPRRNLAHRLRITRLLDLGTMQNYVEDFTTASRTFHRVIEASEAMLQQFPEDPTVLAMFGNRLCHIAYVLRDRFRQQDLAEAAQYVKRAIEIDARIPPGVVSARRARWLLQAALAGIEESRGSAEAGPLWAALDGILPAAEPMANNAEQNEYLVACVGIARWWIDQGALDRATARLQAARTFLELNPGRNKLAIEIDWLQARVDGARGDHESAADAAQRILASRNTWYSRRRAADCVYVAWRAATAVADLDPEVASGYRQQAVQWYEMVVRSLDEDVEKTPQDPWYVLPWAFSKLHLADLAAAAGDTAAAQELLGSALPRLEAVRSEAQMDQWDEPSFRAGKDLAERLGR